MTDFRTENDLIVAVLEEIGFLPIGQTPGADEYETVKRVARDVHAMLDDGRYPYPTYPDDEIPTRIFRPLVRLVAAYCSGIFGLDLVPETALRDQIELLVYYANDPMPLRPMRTDYPLRRCLTT